MPVEFVENTAVLVAATVADDLEELVAWLRATAEPRVDLSRCTHLHTGVLQALTAFRPQLAAAPTEEFLTRHLLPVLRLPLAPAAAVQAPSAPAPGSSTRRRSPTTAAPPGAAKAARTKATTTATPAAAKPAPARRAGASVPEPTDTAANPPARQRKPRTSKPAAAGR